MIHWDLFTKDIFKLHRTLSIQSVNINLFILTGNQIFQKTCFSKLMIFFNNKLKGRKRATALSPFTTNFLMSKFKTDLKNPSIW